MPEIEEKSTKTKRRQQKRLIRTLLLVALGLALIITVQIGIVYYEGAQAGDNAKRLLSAFNDKAGSTPTAIAGAEETPGAAMTEEPELLTSEADLASAAAANEHMLEDDSAGVDEGGEYVQPDMPSITERDKIIAEVTSKVGEDGIIGVLSIPEIEIELPVIGKWSYSLLKMSVCRYKGPGANEKGNLVVLGHNYKNGSHFGNLDKLKDGSELFLTDLNSNRVRYVVYEVKTVEPTAFSELDKYEGDCGLTLVTCINSGTNRQVFRCKQEAA